MPNLRLWSEQELARLRQEMDRLFDDFQQDLGLTSRRCAPMGGAQLLDEGDVLTVRMEVPGCAPCDLDVVIYERELLVAFQSRAGTSRSGAVQTGGRRLRLPGRIDVERAEARLSGGVLRIRLPKSRAAAGRRLPVISD